MSTPKLLESSIIENGDYIATVNFKSPDFVRKLYGHSVLSYRKFHFDKDHGKPTRAEVAKEFISFLSELNLPKDMDIRVEKIVIEVNNRKQFNNAFSQ